MHKSIQRVLKRIKENGLDNDTVLGDSVSDILFSDCAIFIDEQRKVFLLQSPSKKGSVCTCLDYKDRQGFELALSEVLERMWK